MSSTSLALTYDEIRRLVGERRGYGPSITDWSDDDEKVARIEDCLRTGARMFYNQANHDWSFMKPVVSFALPTGRNEVALDAKFGFLDGRLYFNEDAGVAYELRVENKAKVLLRRQQDDTSTGPPQYAAIDERDPGTTHGQRKFLIVWPTADQAYTLTGQFSILADALSTSDPYPWGGPAHAETIKQACLAASEQWDGTVGVSTMLYEKALAASIEYDKRVKPQELSKMRPGPMDRWGEYVTYTQGDL